MDVIEAGFAASSNGDFEAVRTIAEHIREGELTELKAEVQQHMQQVLRALVIDTDSDHNTNETAKRVAKMFVEEVFRGRYVPMSAVTEFPNFSRLNELMIVGPITVRSACSQIQEEAVVMLADALQERVKPDGMAIVMEADHFCMHWRGVKDDDTAMTNSVMRGAFLKDPNLRREFLSLLSKKNAS